MDTTAVHYSPAQSKMCSNFSQSQHALCLQSTKSSLHAFTKTLLSTTLILSNWYKSGYLVFLWNTSFVLRFLCHHSHINCDPVSTCAIFIFCSSLSLFLFFLPLSHQSDHNLSTFTLVYHYKLWVNWIAAWKNVLNVVVRSDLKGDTVKTNTKRLLFCLGIFWAFVNTGFSDCYNHRYLSGSWNQWDYKQKRLFFYKYVWLFEESLFWLWILLCLKTFKSLYFCSTRSSFCTNI